MDQQTIREAVSEMEKELAASRAQVTKWEEAVRAMKMLLHDDTELPGAALHDEGSDDDVIVTAKEDAPRGRDAIRRVLLENVGSWVPIGDLTDTLVERRWVQSARPREAVRTSAARLVDGDPTVEKDGSRYRLVEKTDRFNFADSEGGGADDAS